MLEANLLALISERVEQLGRLKGARNMQRGQLRRPLNFEMQRIDMLPAILQLWGCRITRAMAQITPTWAGW